MGANWTLQRGGSLMKARHIATTDWLVQYRGVGALHLFEPGEVCPGTRVQYRDVTTIHLVGSCDLSSSGVRAAAAEKQVQNTHFCVTHLFEARDLLVQLSRREGCSRGKAG